VVRARSSLFFVAVGATTIGCSLLESFDGYTTDDAGAPDASDAFAPETSIDVALDTTTTTDAPPIDSPAPFDADAAVDTSTCLPPDLECGGACIDPSTDVHHCGGCSVDCIALHGAASTCTSGACGCAAGTKCAVGAGFECVSLDDDPRHCGGCTTPCTHVGDACSGGACDCSYGLTYCSSVDACVDLEGDANHCTACDTICTSDNTCRGAAHELSGYFCVLNTYGCPSGTTACASDRGNFSCFSLQTDPTHCGTCATACAIDQLCVGGACVRYRPAVGCTSAPCACPAGYSDCPALAGAKARACVEGSVCP